MLVGPSNPRWATEPLRSLNLGFGNSRHLCTLRGRHESWAQLAKNNFALFTNGDILFPRRDANGTGSLIP